MSTTISAPAKIAPATAPAVILPKPTAVFRNLLRADLITQWRNRRATILVVLIPSIILVSWRGLISKVGPAFVLASCITVGLNAIGLMGYTNTIARDREKGIFQRLRITPAPRWTIMVSRLTVQLLLIGVMTVFLFIVGYQADQITMQASGYALAFCVAIAGGAVYLSLGQAIVGLIRNPETVNVVTRLVFFLFIMVGMVGSIGGLGDITQKVSQWTPYGTVERILADALNTRAWSHTTTMALLATIGYTFLFTIVGIRYFRWQSSK